MTLLEFWSRDSRFGLRIEEKQVSEILRLCRMSGRDETGGILLGYYSKALDCAVVTHVTEAPSDSKSGRTWFVRGVQGLQRLVDRLWQRDRTYYLGEWHFHPYGAPRPSQTDLNQMWEIASASQYHCPEPVLLILGGDPSSDWSACAYVFPRQRQYLEMYQQP